MKFSYRVILLLAAGLSVAAVLLVWQRYYSRAQRHRLYDAVPSRNRPELSAENPDVNVAPFDRDLNEIFRDHSSRTLRKESNDSIKIYRARTQINTFDLLNEINDETGLRGGDAVPTRPGTAPMFDPENEDLPKKLKVIVVPHSHNDPGWIKTIDSYFEDQTRHILDNMVEKLLKYPKMTFIWAESVLLSMWWKGIDDDKRQAVLTLIGRRQLEIVGGGWVVTDEANCHYSAIVDQMIEGHRWLGENLGVIPKNTWSLDPFGYSSLLPYLYKRVGFENSVILRVTEGVKAKLQQQKAMEFRWRQVWDQRNETDFFTLMMPYMLYNIKHACGPDKDICLMFDFRQIEGEISETRAIPIHSGNVDRQAKLLLAQYQKKASLYKHGVVLIPLGDDFRYDRSLEWDQQFKNYMKLFNYINSQKSWNVEVRFGTVKDYFDEVQKVVAELGKDKKDYFPALSGDFFPYTDRNEEYWTGYFTTRPFSKALGRELEVYLRAAEILNTLSIVQRSPVQDNQYNKEENLKFLDLARKNLGLFQHHDAITGTANAWVVQDYEGRLHGGLLMAQSVINNTIAFLLRNHVQSPTPVAVRVLDPLNSRTLMSVQVVRLSGNKIKVLIFNSIARQRLELVQLLVDKRQLEVVDSEENVVTSQTSPVWSNNVEQSSDKYVLSFLADLPPLGIVAYGLVETDTVKGNRFAEVQEFHRSGDQSDVIVLENDILQANVSISRGQLMSLGFKKDGTRITTSMKFLFYSSRRSGAYIFAPNGPASANNFTRPLRISSTKGPVFSEVRIKYDCVTHVLRVVNCSGPLGSVVEVNNVVDLTSHVYDELELIMRLDSSVRSRDVFYTDQNGFHVMRRRRLTNLLLEANYYPATSVVYVKDEKWRLSMITAQPVGVSSLKEGSIEVMLDRRLRYDDGRGLGAGVQDNRVVLSRFYILPEFVSNSPPSDPDLLSMPTLLANILVDSLRNYPILATSNFAGKLPALRLASLALPCDTLLVNLKTFVTVSNVAAVILHRQGHSGNHQSPLVLSGCNQVESSVMLQGLFSGMRVDRIFEAGLSFTHRIRELDAGHSLAMAPMELYAYEIVYG